MTPDEAKAQVQEMLAVADGNAALVLRSIARAERSAREAFENAETNFLLLHAALADVTGNTTRQP